MRKTYQVLATIIPVLVLAQAASMAFAISSLFTWVRDEGGAFDKAAWDSEDFFLDGPLLGYIVHSLGGMILIPLVALVLLIVSFWAKVPRGTLFAAVILGLIVVQVILGVAHLPITALVHGINALLIFGASIAASRNARVSAPVAA